VVVRFDIPNWLAPGRYAMTPSLARAGTGQDALALAEDMTSLVIHGTGSGGILELPVTTRIERT
jgi:ABC-2 type transport system ATP-binding protein